MQAPLGDAAPGRGAGPVPVAAGLSRSPGDESPRRSSTVGLPETRNELGSRIGSRRDQISSDLGMGAIDLGPSRPAGPAAGHGAQAQG